MIWFGLVWFYGISTIVGYLMPNPFCTYKQFYFRLFSLVNKIKSFQVLLSITNNSIKNPSFIYTQLNVKAFQLLTIEFSIIGQFSSIWPIDRTLPDAATPGQSRTGSDGNKGILRISQCSSITRYSLSDCLIPYPGQKLEESHPSAVMQSVFLLSQLTSPVRYGVREMKPGSCVRNLLVDVFINESNFIIPYNFRADVVRLLVEQYDTKSNVKLGGVFRSQLLASYVSSHSKQLRYNETICR